MKGRISETESVNNSEIQGERREQKEEAEYESVIVGKKLNSKVDKSKCTRW